MNILKEGKMGDPQTFLSSEPLGTAVLFMVYNRLETTRKVFASIKEARPSRLYIAADGPRKGVADEMVRVEAVKKHVMSGIDWPCETRTLFRESNLGCKYAVSDAISWFFKHEKSGIILEDDCLPVQSFFRYCEELLQRYADDKRIWHISGNNFQNGRIRGDGDYYFSKYNHIWGWATWADRWEKYDVELAGLDSDSVSGMNFLHRREADFWLQIFNKMKNCKIDTWDYQWCFTMWLNNGLAILPNTNLVSNIGYGNDATHTTGSIRRANLNTVEIDGPLTHPSEIRQNLDADEYTCEHCFAPRPIHQRIINRLKDLYARFVTESRRNDRND